MDSHLRRVTTLPLRELWNDGGTVDAERLHDVEEDEIRQLLRLGAPGVIASPALGSVRLEDFPDGRCWRASEWRLADDSKAILFESWH